MGTNVTPREPSQEDVSRAFEMFKKRIDIERDTKRLSEDSFKRWAVEQMRDICEKLGLIYESVMVFFSDIKSAAREGWQAGVAKARAKRLYLKG
jgi:hypothetical protein